MQLIFSYLISDYERVPHSVDLAVAQPIPNAKVTDTSAGIKKVVR